MDPMMEGTDLVLDERPAVPRAGVVLPDHIYDVTPILPTFDDLLEVDKAEYSRPLAERAPRLIPDDRHPASFIGPRWREYAATMGWRTNH